MATALKSRTKKMSGGERAAKERAALKKSGLIGADGAKYVCKPLTHAPSIDLEVHEPDENEMIYIEIYGLVNYTKTDGTKDQNELMVSFDLDPKTGVIEFGDWNG